MNINQVYSKDLCFWRPTTKRVHDNISWASVIQIDGKAKVSIPATSVAVQRSNGYAAYLRHPFYFEPTKTTHLLIPQITELSQGYPDQDGNVTPRKAIIYAASSLAITSDGNPSTSPIFQDLVGSYILIDGSTNNGNPLATKDSDIGQLVANRDPTDILSFKPPIGVYGQFYAGKTNSRNSQYGWLIGGNSSFGTFSPKASADVLTLTHDDIDDSLSLVCTNFAIAARLFPTCCVIESDLYSDQLLLTGGLNSWTTGSTSTYILSPSGVVRNSTVCPEAMVKSSAISIPNSNVILMTGGLNSGLTSSKNSAFFFSPYTSSWTATTQPLITARRDHQTAIVNNYLGTSGSYALIVGGKTGIFKNDGQTGPEAYPTSSPINKCEIIDVTCTGAGQVPTTVFSATGNMSTGIYAFGMTKLPDGRVLVCGGIGYPPNYPIPSYDATQYEHPYELNSCEVFDPAAGLWTPINSMNNAHSYCVCSYVAGTDKVYVYGGYHSASIEYLDLKTMQWHISRYTLTQPLMGATPINMNFSFLALIGGMWSDTYNNAFTPNINLLSEPPS